MTGEDIVDCVMAIDGLLAETESDLENKRYSDALKKLREARDAIEELRHEDEISDDREVEMDVMRILK